MKTELSPRVPRRRSAGFLTVLETSAALLLAQSHPALSVEIHNGAIDLMDHNPRPSSYLRLQPGMEIPGVNARIAADHNLPERILRCVTLRGNEPPIPIAVHIRSSGVHHNVLVIVHGLLASHESWRYLTGDLANDFDLWIVDLPGCGDSGKPDPDSLAPDGYSPAALADRVLQAIAQCLKERSDSPRLILVAHSLGGMIALRMMDDPDLRSRYAPVRQHVDGMVLLAPADVSVNCQWPWIKQILELNPVKVGIGDLLGEVQEAAARSVVNGFVHASSATREDADELYHVLTDPKRLRAAQAMLRQAVPWNVKENRPDHDGIERLVANYANIDVPCSIVWGSRDEILAESTGYKLQAQIPGARLAVLKHCMHSIELECPAVCAELIRGLDSELHGTHPDGRPARQLTANIEILG